MVRLLVDLPVNLLESILLLVVQEDPKSFASIRASCKRLKEIADGNVVSSKLDVFVWRQRIKIFEEDFHQLIRMLASRNNLKAHMLLGAQLFFNLSIRTEGLGHLLQAIKAGPISWYVYSLALIATEEQREYGCGLLQQCFDEPCAKKFCLRCCRKVFRDMVSDDGRKCIPPTRICNSQGDTHWDRKWGAVTVDRELKITCPMCCVDVETFKMRSGFP